ncbi:MAG: DUF2490 domain-containing protein [Capsulimonadales bacterium]|nr:DUF2490 domain-containing protein [Capsulimonadales bacterium]
MVTFRKYRPSYKGLRLSGLLLLGVLSSAPVAAQETDGQQWTLLTFNARVGDRMRLYLEVQPRLGYDYRSLDRLLLRPAFGYQVHRNVSIWLGYGWTPTFQPEFRHEGRWFQQVLVENRFPTLDLVNRTRLEQRSIAGAGARADRLRHLVRVAYPLTRDRRWAAVWYDEIFWNLNDTPRGPQAGFDQNRVYFGLAHSPSRHVRYEIGYLPTFLNPPRGGRDRRLDILFLGVNYNL